MEILIGLVLFVIVLWIFGMVCEGCGVALGCCLLPFLNRKKGP